MSNNQKAITSGYPNKKGINIQYISILVISDSGALHKTFVLALLVSKVSEDLVMYCGAIKFTWDNNEETSMRFLTSLI